ncbi:MAG: beta-ketoacyl synthase N-terminal-like domain-containing protein [Acidobacteriota bacterium]
MDAQAEAGFPDSIVVSGLGAVVLSPKPSSYSLPCNTELELLPWLKSKKTRKFMGRQDQLAVIAAGLAVRSASIDEPMLRDHTGIYTSIGYIPFDRNDIELIARNSQENGNFSMARFSVDGFGQVNPLLTFRCLPNMPAFHISLNLGIEGPYFVGYPGVGQFYIALQQAVSALLQNEIDIALVGGVADQNNFLVLRHYHRFPHFQSRICADAAGFLCLERHQDLEKRGITAKLVMSDYEIVYDPVDPMNIDQTHFESLKINNDTFDVEVAGYLGAASLPVFLNWLYADRKIGEAMHRVAAMDGIYASSNWKLL